MWFERVIWFPVLGVFVVALGVSSKHLTPPPVEPTTAQAISVLFAGAIAGFTITYAPPWVPILRCTVPRMDPGQVFFLYEGHRTSDYPRIHLLVEEFPPFASRIFVLRRGSSCDVVVAQFARMDESGPSAMSWSSMCHRRPNRVIVDSSV